MKQEFDHDIKLVVVGDGGVGKTSLLVSYTHNYFPGDYIPTVFEHYTANVVWSTSRKSNSGNNYSRSGHKKAERKKTPLTPVNRINNSGIGIGQRLDSLGSPSSTPKTPDDNNNNLIVRLSLWDTAGQEDYDKLRPMSYPHTNVFMLCYSTVDYDTAKSIGRKWVPELREHTPEVPIILVGTKIDLRDHRSIKLGDKALTREDGLQMMNEHMLDGFMECSALSKKGLMECFDECIAAVVCPTDRKKAGKNRRKKQTGKKILRWKKACTLM